jgi:RNA polymerase sigma factor FliA
VKKIFGRWVDKTLFHRTVEAPVPAPNSKQPATISDSAQLDTSPRPPPPGTTPRLTREDAHLVIENLPAVRLAARRVYRLMPDHVSFAKLYSAGVTGLIGALDEFHSFSPAGFSDFAKLKIRDAILGSLPRLTREGEEQRQKGIPIEVAIRELRTELDRNPNEVEISNEMHIDLLAYRGLLGELHGIEIGTLLSQRRRDSAEEDLIDLGGSVEGNSRFIFQRANLQESLTEAITSLPERERLVLNLFHYEELTLKEIGLVLDEQQARVTQIYTSAILYLRSQLSGLGYR